MRKIHILAILLLAMTFCACGGSSHSIGVSAVPATSALDQGQATTVTATVTNDSTNSGVTFALSCSVSSCGSLSGATSTTVAYTAPSAVASSMQVTITAKSAKDSTKEGTTSITVNPPLAIAMPTTAQLTGTVGSSYSLPLGSGGTGPFTWQITSGTLPAGLTLNTSAATGATVITGKPTGSGSSTITIKVTDSSGGTAGAMSMSLQLTIAVNPAPLAIVTTSLPNGVVSASYSAPLVASGGTSAYTWSVASGSTLPSWLTISGSGTSWTISGTAPATPGTSSTFELTVTDSSTPAQSLTTQQLSVTVTAASAACGTGHESALTGQYAFGMSGFMSTGYMAAIGSFTADGSGHITAGMADANGVSGVLSGSITASGSSYTVGADNRGCATIVTPYKTYTVRFALENNPSGAALEGSVENWESGSGAWIASGQILKQTVPTAMTNGTYVYAQTGVYTSSQYRTGVVGTMTLSSGLVTAGEYDSNAVGSHHSYTGLSGTYTSPDATTGRFTDATTLSGVTAHRVLYAVSSSQFLELTTEALTSFPVLIGKGQLQSGSMTISGNLVFYGTGQESSAAAGAVQLGLVNASGSSLTASIYENQGGVWNNPDPSTSTCGFTVDTYGKVTLSGASCGSNPPVFYLTGANTGLMLGTDGGVTVGELQAQSATSITAGTYYFGMIETVNYPGSSLETEVGTATISSAGVVSGTSDQTSTAISQLGAQPVSYTLTVNSDGTFTDSAYPGQVSGIVISGNKLVIIDNQTSIWPTLLVIKAVPIS